MPQKKNARTTRVRRSERKNIAVGQAHIKSTFNNTIVSITDPQGNVISWQSGGTVGFKGSRKSTPFAAQLAAEAAAKAAMRWGRGFPWLITLSFCVMVELRPPAAPMKPGRAPRPTRRLVFRCPTRCAFESFWEVASMSADSLITFAGEVKAAGGSGIGRVDAATYAETTTAGDGSTAETGYQLVDVVALNQAVGLLVS